MKDLLFKKNSGAVSKGNRNTKTSYRKSFQQTNYHRKIIITKVKFRALDLPRLQELETSTL